MFGVVILLLPPMSKCECVCLALGGTPVSVCVSYALLSPTVIRLGIPTRFELTQINERNDYVRKPNGNTCQNVWLWREAALYTPPNPRSSLVAPTNSILYSA